MMTLLHLLGAFISFNIICSAEYTYPKTCQAREHLRNESCPTGDPEKFLGCIDVCSGFEVKEEEECETTPECCFMKNRCVTKQKSTWFNAEKEKKEKLDVLEKFADNANTIVKTKNNARSSSRNLQIGSFPGSRPPPLSAPSSSGLFHKRPSCLGFPYNCPPVLNLQHITIPPVDIPYCLRTHCSLSDPSLEENMERCMLMPGCYFDNELFYYRKAFGHRILPTVPVCHIAIRNSVFHKKARTYSEKFGQIWNPTVTKCLIAEYRDEIYAPPKGCDMNDVIEYFGYRPKMAGWSGIHENECYLINGCWKVGKGCFYPMQPSDLYVRSGDRAVEQRSHISTSQIFGRQKCQNFDMSTPKDFLISYHTCLSSGCSLDPRITSEMYFYNLWNLTQSLSAQLQYISWMDISNGDMRADNFEDKLQKYRGMSSTDRGTSLVNSFATGASWQVGNLLSTLPLGNTNGLDPVGLNTMPNNNLFTGNTFPPAGGLYMNPFQPNFVAGTFGSFQQGLFSTGLADPPAVKSIEPTHCPFQPVHLYNYPPLKGSFAGCCDVNTCYLPRETLLLQRSGIASYHSEWTQWSACTVSCGGGKSSRTRNCVSREATNCDGVKDESRQCNTNSCPQWAMWGRFGHCSVSCGGGKATRTRKCVGSGCVGDSQQVVDCNSGKCPVLSAWSQWSECSASCGEGTRARYRDCDDGGDYGCKNENPMEETRCRSYCGTVVWSPWSECNYNTCVKTREASCLFEGRPGFCEDFRSIDSENCNRMTCYCKNNPSYFICTNSFLG